MSAYASQTAEFSVTSTWLARTFLWLDGHGYYTLGLASRRMTASVPEPT